MPKNVGLRSQEANIQSNYVKIFKICCLKYIYNSIIFETNAPEATEISYLPVYKKNKNFLWV